MIPPVTLAALELAKTYLDHEGDEPRQFVFSSGDVDIPASTSLIITLRLVHVENTDHQQIKRLVDIDGKE